MSAVFDHARALAKALRESEAARRMKGLGAKVGKDARLDRLLADLRLAQFEGQALAAQGKQPTRELLDRVQKLGAAAQADQTLREYLAAEQAYGELVTEVHNVLAEVFNPDVPGKVRRSGR
jgi:cell fate (sporulation/competence/biofilm development) regulator YlbF (YheA/YmcA/DUF963 family)